MRCDINKMAEQPSDVQSLKDSELFDTPDSQVLKRTPSSSSIVTSITTKKRYSKIWHYTPVDRNEVTFNTNGKSVWRCKYCLKEYLESGRTTIIAGHLKDQHNIDISSTQEARTTLMQANIADAF